MTYTVAFIIGFIQLVTCGTCGTVFYLLYTRHRRYHAIPELKNIRRLMLFVMGLVIGIAIATFVELYAALHLGG